MPIGKFEGEVLRLIAANRRPESHVADATVLNQSPTSPRFSEDIDLFHDTEDALDKSVELDTTLLAQSGFGVRITANQPYFKRAIIEKAGEVTKLEWARDSAFRFFPIEPDPELGYRLNLWDAATNKTLAAAGRAKVRDYVDLLNLHQHHLGLGALIWAAAGKDDGLSPGFIIEELARVQRYPKMDYDGLRLTQPLDSKILKNIWIKALDEARELQHVLLNAPLGCFFLNAQGNPVCPTSATLPTLRPHFGSLHGAWPKLVE